MGESDAGKGQVLASSDLTPLTVAEPYVGMKIEMAAVEQGKPGVVLCKLDHHKTFEGKAKVKLLGLPAKVTAPELEIDKTTSELNFQLTTAADSPKGQHKNLFCHLTIPEATYNILLFVYLPILFLGAVLNAVNLFVILTSDKLRRDPRNSFIVALAFSDLFLCIFTSPLTLWYTLEGHWPLGGSTDLLCKYEVMFHIIIDQTLK